MLSTIVGIIAPEGALQKKVNNTILVKLKRQDRSTYHAYSNMATICYIPLFSSDLGESMYSRLQQMWLQLVSTTMEEWTAY